MQVREDDRDDGGHREDTDFPVGNHQIDGQPVCV
jgi:hypothetical protein